MSKVEKKYWRDIYFPFIPRKFALLLRPIWTYGIEL